MNLILQTPWNSLEIAKIIVALLTPVLIIGVGLFINKSLMKIEHNLWRNQKLIEKRISVYDDLVPDLNDLLCYFTHVGDWKSFKPFEIVKLKRTIDRKIHISAPLFADDFFEACMKFIDLCYETYTGEMKDARLRTSSDDWKRILGDDWNPDWDRLFSNPEKPVSRKAIRDAYTAIIKIFAREMGLNPDSRYVVNSRVTKSFKQT